MGACLRLGRQAGTALGPTVRQDRPASAGTHASPETVLTCPATVVGLEGPLHFLGSWEEIWQKVRIQLPGQPAKATVTGLQRSNRGTRDG